MPLGETAESQQQSRDKLKSLSKQNAPNQDVVKQLTRSTFYTQRKEVNNGKEIKYLLEDWPFLFDEIGMAVHFEELTGVSLKETFVRNLDLKGERLLNYLKTVAVNKEASPIFYKHSADEERAHRALRRCAGDGVAPVVLLRREGRRDVHIHGRHMPGGGGADGPSSLDTNHCCLW